MQLECHFIKLALIFLRTFLVITVSETGAYFKSEIFGETFSQNGLKFGQILTHIYFYVSPIIGL